MLLKIVNYIHVIIICKFCLALFLVNNSFAQLTYNVGGTHINNTNVTTLILPNASSNPGKEIMIKTINNAVNSSSINIMSLNTSSISNAILNRQGNWATLVSNGSLWVIMQGVIN